MSPRECLRWAVAPDERRSTLLLWSGLCILLAAGGLLMSGEASPPAGALLYLAATAGWIVGACGAAGYVRWLFRQSAAEARDAAREPPDRRP